MTEPARDPTAVPIRTTDDWHCEQIDGTPHVTIQRPRRVRNRLDRFLFKLFDTPTDRELELDAVGSAVWLECDGSTTTEEIANELKATFAPERVDPVSETLPYFLTQLSEFELIRYESAAETE
ncbi:PqqD family protein [Halocatena pleomorpha]|uniref:PqqD family protein n=1 Tax=Halocatena pleomorpha TaxID=1785090 RepID=A0A3P3RFB1_9EURY|nr:PqqD family protein [Halocatena pleomorpha]RRJ31450.1 PqqD family protein [Halocatena pleomorpha]